MLVSEAAEVAELYTSKHFNVACSSTQKLKQMVKSEQFSYISTLYYTWRLSQVSDVEANNHSFIKLR
jgi:hypothetical protein